MSNKAIRELYKSTSILKKDVKSWLVKQAIFQVHVLLSKEINHPYFEIKKLMSIISLPQSVFLENTYKYMLTGVNATSNTKSLELLGPKKQIWLNFC